MKLLATQWLKLGDDRFPYRASFRAMIDFEEYTGKSVDTITKINDIAYFLYASIKAGSKAEKIEFKMSFDKFLDVIDAYPGILTEISETLFNAGEESGEVNPK